MPNPANHPILVLGATGKTGSRIASRLRDRGFPVRAVSRSTIPAFDWEDRSTWPAVLDGVKSAYISYVPDLTSPGAVEAIEAFANLATAAGVRHLLLLSGRNEIEAQQCEAALQAACERGGAEWTIMRSSWFAQNFSEGAFLEEVLAGEIALPVGDVPEPFVDIDDLADVAVAALTEPGHFGQTYELTGSRAITFAEAAQEIAKASGRPVHYRKLTRDEFSEGLRAHGVPEETTAVLGDLFTRLFDGRNVHPTDGVERVLGRAARDFSMFARVAAAAGVWGTAPS